MKKIFFAPTLIKKLKWEKALMSLIHATVHNVSDEGKKLISRKN